MVAKMKPNPQANKTVEQILSKIKLVYPTEAAPNINQVGIDGDSIEVAAAAIHQLLNEARMKELVEFVAMLDEQDPYTPLDGTPSQYVNSKLQERLLTLQANLASKGKTDA